MTGTAMPQVTPEWISFVMDNFIEPTIGDSYEATPLVTPAQFWPLTGLRSMTLNTSTRTGTDILSAKVRELMEENATAGAPQTPIAMFGYSQSAFITSIEKRSLLGQAWKEESLPPTSIVMLSNPVRPNGGLFSRFYNLGLIPWTPVVSTATDTPFPTYDIARQYDFFADFPTYPLNVLAVVNSVFGLLNHNYGPVTLDPASPAYDPATVVQRYGDTTYYLIPSKLPLLAPLRAVGLSWLADVVEPALCYLVELGYDRSTPYGQFAPARLLPPLDFGAANAADLTARSVSSESGTARAAAAATASVPTSPAEIQRIVRTEPGKHRTAHALDLQSFVRTDIRLAMPTAGLRSLTTAGAAPDPGAQKAGQQTDERDRTAARGLTQSRVKLMTSPRLIETQSRASR